MIKGVIIKKITKNADARGWLAEFWRSDVIAFRPAMGYMSVTRPGVARGPHEHKYQSDGFVFIGPGNFELSLWDGRPRSATHGKRLKIKVGENNPTLVIVPAGVVHGYKCVGRKDGWCLNLPDKLYRGKGKKQKPDEIRWENNKQGKYKI